MGTNLFRRNLSPGNSISTTKTKESKRWTVLTVFAVLLVICIAAIPVTAPLAIVLQAIDHQR